MGFVTQSSRKSHGHHATPRPGLTGAPSGHLEVLPSQYPQVRRDDTEETLHGVVIQDPYRWLEDADSPDVAKCGCGTGYAACGGVGVA